MVSTPALAVIRAMRKPIWYPAAMAPCSDTGADSTRHASIAMSCVAAQNARSSAHTAMDSTPCEGSLSDMLRMQTAMPACARSIQLRRLPKKRVRNGSGIRSTIGDQMNLNE
jgi:hypothetical protein